MSKIYEELSENELILWVQSGNFDAFSALSARFLWLIKIKVSRVAQSIVGLEWDDLIQEAYISFYQAAKTYKHDMDASFRTYASICLDNQLRDVIRRSHRKGNVPISVVIPIDHQDLSALSSDYSFETWVELEEDYKAAFERLRLHLSPLEQKVFMLYAQGIEKREIEKRIGITRKGLDNAVYRVRSKIRSLFTVG